MKISDIFFDKQGCCGSHQYTEIRQQNGYVSHVQDNGDGTVTVTTHGPGYVVTGSECCLDDASFNARMTADAELI